MDHCPCSGRAARGTTLGPVPTRTATARAVPALAAFALAAVLTGCSAAQDAVTSATDDAKQQATQKAQEIAVNALRAQACALTKDGTLSEDDVRRLTGQLDAAEAAGVPAQVLDVVRPLVEQGAGAGREQVAAVRASTCA